MYSQESFVKLGDFFFCFVSFCLFLGGGGGGVKCVVCLL